MANLLRNLFFWVGLPLAIVVFLLILFADCGDDPGPSTQREVTRQAELFLDQKSQLLPVDERFEIVAVHGPEFGWALILIRRDTDSFGRDSGSSGMLIIGEQVKDGYDFYLQGDPDFDLNLPRIPEGLLDPDLRPYFLSDERHQSIVSALPPGASSDSNKFSDLVFNLPFKAGEPCKVSTPPGQGHHQGVIKHAIDCDAPRGTELVAVTVAEVDEIKDDSSIGGCDPGLAGEANFIRLRLNPLTTILYLHTEPGSIVKAGISEGDTVVPGQTIAKVGHTGFTCNWTGTGPGAHLHLVMEKWCEKGNSKYICDSIAINFQEVDGAPQYGQSYVSKNEFTPASVANDEKATEEAEIRQAKDFIDIFHEVYACSTLWECDQRTLLLSVVTEVLEDTLFPDPNGLSFCFGGCGGTKWDRNQIIKHDPNPFDIPEGKHLTVRSKEIWISKSSQGSHARYGEVTHHTVVDHFLERDEKGLWKVGGFEILCGYTLDEKGELIPDGEVLQDYNLENCSLQPPDGSAKS